ncbi:MAG TPA: TonB-dependent receptor [Phnomibacter sp.]|nr:TonB-dependent receptor [Phnomibacter sp.]
MRKEWIVLAAIVLPALHTMGQQAHTQHLKGNIVDAETRRPIAGATVSLTDGGYTLSDSLGRFSFLQVPVGRRSLTITMMGYEDAHLDDIQVTSGKQTELTIALTEKLNRLNEVVVRARKHNGRALNEFAGAGSRSFSVEDTRRYPAAVSDPARMALNFAGVSGNGDMGNEIVVRGNSPRGMLWRLEGIEIPNPNHFASLGNSGGAISMLSSSTLGTSDFYTGAFPAEMGNATAGVFDLNLRHGNRQKREYAFMIGALGMEASAEGPLGKTGQASYLLNYRYSTLALLRHVIGGMREFLPIYQDISFKVQVPTAKAGTFSLFGLGGTNQNKNEPIADSTRWETGHGNHVIEEKGKMGVLGISHHLPTSTKGYLKTVVAFTYNSLHFFADTLDPHDHYKAVPTMRNETTDRTYRLNTFYHHKLNNRHALRTGVTLSRMHFNYKDLHYVTSEQVYKESLASAGTDHFYQAYAQWKTRLNDQWTLNGGVHGSLLDVNRSWSIEPRLSVQYRPGNHQTLTLASGLHARPEHLSTYYFQPQPANGQLLPNKDLQMPKAFHTVLSYEKNLKGGMQWKTELYYQHLYNIGVEAMAGSEFSVLNMSSFWDLLNRGPLASTGTGKNYGIDMVLEKPFRNNYYFMATASLFRSTYTNYSGNRFNTRFDRVYQTNWVAGKEWKKGNNKTLGINGRLLASGGQRESPIDLEASRAAGKRVNVPGQYFSQAGPLYFRSDISFSYRINGRATTHTLMLDVQNVTNRQNLLMQYYDSRRQDVRNAWQMGLVPVLNYRVEF